jgi:hypothetical protein
MGEKMTPEKPKRVTPLAKGGAASLGNLKSRCTYAMLRAKHGRRHAHLWDFLLSDDWFLKDEWPDRPFEAELAWALDRERNKGRVVDPAQLRVFGAYYTLLTSKKRPPLIAELLRELKINKPRRTECNMQEWLQANSRERVIRKTLKKVGLPLLEGKRGRRW